jgi:hypothetical protein
VSVGFSGGTLSAQLSVMREKFPGNETVYGNLVQRVYERGEENARIDQLIDFLLESIKDRNVNDPSVMAHFSSFLSFVPIIAPVFKDQAFRGEKEWRVVIYSTSPYLEGAKFRFSDSMLIPYVELPLESEPGVGVLSGAIDRIVIGPTPHKELSLDSVRRLVLKFEFPGDRVSNSDVPYRHW